MAVEPPSIGSPNDTHAPGSPPSQAAPAGVGRPMATAFRGDIQGLRAVAVLLVVVNHLFPDLVPGGFIGVDVFLVVSGFLITTLMLREVRSTGRFSLPGFYARRARRILPAATLVIAVTVVAAWLTFPLLRAREVVTDAWWTIFFLGNVRMASVDADYFAADALPSPLRHYWSLAVEEQFYLVWPLLFAICFWLALLVRRRRVGVPADGSPLSPVQQQPSLRVAVWLLLLTVVASLVWSWHATAISPSTAYYSTFARAHELALGALLAFLPDTAALTRRARELLVWSGIAAIATASVLFDAETAFPGLAALVPTLGTAAVLVAGTAGAHANLTASGSRLLGVRPLGVVGDWSYSLYLWHWPVIVVAGALLGEDALNASVKVGLLSFMLLLSWASYELVESPFRSKRRWLGVRGGLAVYPITLVACLAITAVVAAGVERGLQQGQGPAPVEVTGEVETMSETEELLELVATSVEPANQQRDVTGDLVPSLAGLEGALADLGGCDYTQVSDVLCAMGDTDSERDVVVLGDSLARAFSPAVVEMGREHGYRVHVLGFPACPLTSLVQPRAGGSEPWTECEEFKAWALETVAEIEPEMVLVASSAARVIAPTSGQVVRDDADEFLSLLHQGWSEVLTELSASAQTVAVVANTPRFPTTPGECLTDGDPLLADCTFAPAEQASEEAQQLLRAARDVDAIAIDAQSWFCADGRCPMVVGEFVTMRDTHHVTPQFAVRLAGPLAEALEITPAD